MHINFTELLVVLLVALLVIRPDRLPGAAYTLGVWVKRARNAFNQIKRELDSETRNE